MASMAMTCCASLSAPLVSIKPPSKVVGSGPCSAVSSFAVPKKPSLRSGNLVVRAQQSGGGNTGGGGNVEGQSPKSIAHSKQFWDVERPIDIKGPYDVLPYGLEVSYPKMKLTIEEKMRDFFTEIETVVENLNMEGELVQPRIPWEVIDADKELKVRFDMPGLVEKDVQVTIDGNMLVIKGKHSYEQEGSDNAWLRRRYRSYDTRIELPDDCDKDERKLSKSVKDGVLHVLVPKKGNNIPVKGA